MPCQATAAVMRPELTGGATGAVWTGGRRDDVRMTSVPGNSRLPFFTFLSGSVALKTGSPLCGTLANFVSF